MRGEAEKFLKLSEEMAAYNADSPVAPLLYFYSLVNLVKAALTVRTGRYEEDVMHGLTARVAGEESIPFGKEYRLADETVVIKKEGLFPRFIVAFGLFVPPGTKFTAKELMKFLPELYGLVEETYGEPSYLLDFEAEKVWSEKAIPLTWKGRRFLLYPYRRGDESFCIDPFVARYMLFFIMSMLVRYDARKWLFVWEGGSGEREVLRSLLSNFREAYEGAREKLSL